MRSCFVRGSVATTASSVGGLAATINLRPPPEVTILLNDEELFEEKERELEMVEVFRIWKLCGVASWRRVGEVEEASLNIVVMIVELELEIEN